MRRAPSAVARSTGRCAAGSPRLDAAGRVDGNGPQLPPVGRPPRPRR